jgi:hypothetical protein
MATKGATVQGPTGTISASSTKTGIILTAAATRLLRICRIRVSQDTHKTSEQYAVAGQRASAAGTSSAYTPVLKEPNSGAVGFTAGITHTVEPTYTASTIFPNTKWNSLTGKDIPFPMGQELYVAPSAIWGLYVTTPASTTNFAAQCEIEAEEIG